MTSGTSSREAWVPELEMERVTIHAGQGRRTSGTGDQSSRSGWSRGGEETGGFRHHVTQEVHAPVRMSVDITKKISDGEKIMTGSR